MTRHLYILILTLCAIGVCTGQTLPALVDTRVGTAHSQTLTSGQFGKHTEELGQTIPAVLMPNGMNFWTPQTRDTERKCVSPYYYADTLLQGFRNSHWLNGGCTQDYGSMTLMPLTGCLRMLPEQRASRFSHDDEIARPDYYRVYLPDEGVTCEMTGRSRAAIMRFTPDEATRLYIVVNPNSDEGQGMVGVDTVDVTRQGRPSPQSIDAHAYDVTGRYGSMYGYNPVHRIYQSKGEGAGFAGHFVVEFNQPYVEYGCYQGDKAQPGRLQIARKPQIGAYMAFDVTPEDPLVLRVGTSFTGHDGALANLRAEMPTWDFDGVRERMEDLWDVYLRTIEVETPIYTPDVRGEDATPSQSTPDPTLADRGEDTLQKFYGALYRTSFLPHEINDCDGRYPAFDAGYPIMQLSEGETSYYDGFSMWDTYRALHPLINLLFPTMGGEMMQSLVHKYEQGGWLPIFPCWNSYTCAMIGDHAIAAIADAYVKGIRNFDVDKAYEAMRRNAFEMPTDAEYLDGKGRRALKSYLEYGYIPVEDSVPDAYHRREQTSRTLEYAYDDWALAQMAKALGHTADYETLMLRSANWRNVINPTTGYADGRHADGTWTGDDPTAFSKHITEGAPCHYSWYVPHDPEGLIEVMGGTKRYLAKLDSMFSQGRYWHGNEPCHQVAYMYSYAGRPSGTSRAVRHIMDTEYLNCPGGLSGNDDAGQMSAWYVFAALGFYPVCPGSEQYIISGPTFKKATIHLENGRDLILLAPEASPENIYVRAIRHNGKPYTAPYLLHSELMEGGILEFDMAPAPKAKL